MDLHKWPRLFEIDPELRPNIQSGAFVLGHRDDYAQDPWGWQVAIDYGLGTKGQIDDVDEIDAETAAALIRDRAVLRLAESHGYVLGKLLPQTQAEWYVYEPSRRGDVEVISHHTDPTEALYLAWCGKLGVTP